MTDSFKELQLRADEWIATGAEPGAEAFETLGFNAEELAEALQDPSRLMTEVINRTRRLNSEAARLRIFNELLGGTGGEQLVRLLGMSREEIAAIVVSARDAGQIIGEDVFDAGDRWRATTRDIKNDMRAASLAARNFVLNLASDVVQTFFDRGATSQDVLAADTLQIMQTNRAIQDRFAQDVEEAVERQDRTLHAVEELKTAQSSVLNQISRQQRRNGFENVTEEQIQSTVSLHDELAELNQQYEDGAITAADYQNQAGLLIEQMIMFAEEIDEANRDDLSGFRSELESARDGILGVFDVMLALNNQIREFAIADGITIPDASEDVETLSVEVARDDLC